MSKKMKRRVRSWFWLFVLAVLSTPYPFMGQTEPTMWKIPVWAVIELIVYVFTAGFILHMIWKRWPE